jgi:hypothetical protein
VNGRNDKSPEGPKEAAGANAKIPQLRRILKTSWEGGLESQYADLFRPSRALQFATRIPGAYAPGFILAPLRGLAEPHVSEDSREEP